MTTFDKIQSLLSGDADPTVTVQQYAKEARFVDDLQVGLFEKADGSQWIRNADGSQTQLLGGDGGGVIYGDGSDGAHICVDGETMASGFYTDYTIPEGVTVICPQFDTVAGDFNQITIYCTGTFSILGTIDMSGVDAIDRNGGAGGSGGSSGSDGLDGGQTNGTPRTYASGQALAGGRGGQGSDGLGSVLVDGVTIRWRNSILLLGRVSTYAYTGGGGGGGGGDGTNYGGGGGEGGHTFVVCAKQIIHGPENVYNLQGGAGAPGGDDGSGSTGHGQCGGGGGGAAGWWMTISDEIEGDAVIVGVGGAGGEASGDLALPSVLQSTTPIMFPVTIGADSNDDFVFNGTSFAIPPGTYSTKLALATAVGLAVSDGGTFNDINAGFWDIEAGSGSTIKFVSSINGGGSQFNDTAITDGTHNALPTLGFANNDASSGGADGSSDGDIGPDGFVIHILN